MYEFPCLPHRSRARIIETLNSSCIGVLTVFGPVLKEQLIHNVFQTNLVSLMAIALVESLSIALILLAYLRRWKLSRPVTSSPVEIAKVHASCPLMVVADTKFDGLSRLQSYRT